MLRTHSRIHWIDVCKGLGILLVMFTHRLAGYVPNYLIFAFHIPLFFFLSGVVFDERASEHLSLYIKKKIQRLVVPYFLIAFVSYSIWFGLNFFFHQTGARNLQEFLAIFYGSPQEELLSFNSALWFIPCLFLTSIIFATLKKYVRSKAVLIGLLCGSSLIGFSLSLTTVKLPWTAEVAFTTLPLFGFGFLSRKWLIDRQAQLYRFRFFLCAAGFSMSAVLSTLLFWWYHNKIDLRINKLDNYFLFYGAALAGILGCVFLSYIIGQNRWLAKIGQHSFTLFAWHLVVYNFFDVLANHVLHVNIWVIHETLFAFVLMPLVYTCMTLVLILAGEKFLYRFKARSTVLEAK